METYCGPSRRCVVLDGSWVTPDLQCLVTMIEAPAFSKPVYIFLLFFFLRNLLLQAAWTFGLPCLYGRRILGLLSSEMLLAAEISSSGLFFCPTAFSVTSKGVAQSPQIMLGHFDFV